MFLSLNKIATFIALVGSARALCVCTDEPTLVVVDEYRTPGTPSNCDLYCEKRGITIKHIQSPTHGGHYGWSPEPDTELEWLSDGTGLLNTKKVFALSASDPGLEIASRITEALDLAGSTELPSLRDKSFVNERARLAGLSTVEQLLTSSWKEAEDFIKRMWNRSRDKKRKNIVLKPRRGVSSRQVYFCSSLGDAKSAFHKIIGQPQYGGGTNTDVLIQEFVEGPEYAVDTVARDGVIKVLALWKYEKVPMGGAPFVYQCTELMTADTPIHAEICDYCVAVLRSQNMTWGPAHTEIRYGKDGPRLMELNACWHGNVFVPIVRAVLDTDAVTATLDAFFDPDAYHALPDRPFAELQSRKSAFNAGMIVHITTTQRGTITAVNHEDELRALPSAYSVNVQLHKGMSIDEFHNYRVGRVLLIHADPAVVRADYARIKVLEKTMFEVSMKTRLKTAFEKLTGRLRAFFLRQKS